MVSYSSGVACSRFRNEATLIGNPTRSRKYATVRSLMSAAFSWKPNGVSSSTAGTGRGPSRESRSACTDTIVGVVSPDPMMQSNRGTRAAPVAAFTTADIQSILRPADGATIIAGGCGTDGPDDTEGGTRRRGAAARIRRLRSHVGAPFHGGADARACGDRCRAHGRDAVVHPRPRRGVRGHRWSLSVGAVDRRARLALSA